MHIGLIGGIGPAATDFYYRRLISTFASKKAALELTIVHADTPTLLGNLASNDAATQVAIFMKLTNRLAAAGPIVSLSRPSPATSVSTRSRRRPCYLLST